MWPAVGAARSKAVKVTGSYLAPVGSLDVVAVGRKAFRFSLMVAKGAHVGEACGTVKLQPKGRAVYRKGRCRIAMRFVGNKRVIVKQQSSAGDCDFGVGVTANGTYKRRAGKKPSVGACPH